MNLQPLFFWHTNADGAYLEIDFGARGKAYLKAADELPFAIHNSDAPSRISEWLDDNRDLIKEEFARCRLR